MKVILITNQNTNPEAKTGNPIIVNMLHQLRRDLGDENVDAITIKYLPSIKTIKHIKKFDLIHVHFGGLYAFLLGFICKKKIITFHGTDIHGQVKGNLLSVIKAKTNVLFSLFCFPFYKRIGFVSTSLIQHIPNLVIKIFSSKFFINNLGVNYDKFKIIDQNIAKSKLGLKRDVKYVLFSSVSLSSNKNKRYDLAKNIISDLGRQYEMLPLTGIASHEVPNYINASDFLLITSDFEGSPNIVRECLALNVPIFSYPVGDLQELSQLTSHVIILPRESITESVKIIKAALLPNICCRSSLKKLINISYTTSKQINEYRFLINK